MSTRTHVQRLLSSLALLALLLAPLQSLAQPSFALPPPVGQIANLSNNASSTGLFRTRVTIRTPADWARLEKLGVVLEARHGLSHGYTDGEGTFRASVPESVSMLTDEDQLEALARLRFEPQSTDELGALVAAHAQTKPWLAAGLQPLLTKAAALQAEVQRPALSGAEGSQGAEVQGSAGAEETASPEVVTARAGLRAALHALTPEQQAGIASLPSVDDDADGLTNTQEAWWCTDPMNPDSDGDGVKDGDEVQAAKDWLANRRAGPPASGKPFAGWPPQIPGCRDDDQDSVPDLAERWELGLNMNRESTDRDKFDDGQELFGLTYCPGSGGYCGYGALPRNEDWGVIFAEMPSWVKAPGNHPLVAAFPVPEVDVVPSSFRMQAVTTVTTDHTISSGTERSYSTAKTEGTSTSLADTVTWNEWQEQSIATTVPLSGLALEPQFVYLTAPVRIAGAKWDILKFSAAAGLALCVIATGGGCAIPAAIAGAGVALGDIIVNYKESQQRQAEMEKLQDDIKRLKQEQATCRNNSCKANAGSLTNPLSIDYQRPSVGTQDRNAGDRKQAGVTANSQAFVQQFYQLSYPQYLPTQTTTNTQGRSWGGARTTTNTKYEEHTITNGEAFSSNESWGNATAVDSSHAADLWFTYKVRNSGTEYAREIANLAFNIYIGDDPNPAYTYFIGPDLGGDGKFHNFMPAEEHTYTSRRIPLTLEQMKAIDLGGPVRIVVEDFTYGIDELFYQDAANAGVLAAIEDGTDDGDEAIDTYLIPTWGTETVLDVLARYYPHTTDADGNLIAIWTPEYRADTPAWCNEPRRVGTTLWCRHALSTADWWNVYLNGLGDGSEGFQDTPAAPGSVALFRFNKDSDLDGYSDRSERRLGTDPNNPASHPRPELIAGVYSIRSGNAVTATLSLLNTGLYDAYGVEAVMIAPDDSVSITNNTVGGSGRVRAQKQVIVGSRILLQSPLPPQWTQSGHARPAVGGYYTGSADRTYTFTVQCANPAGCDVGAGTWTLAWNDGAGGSGQLNFGSGYASPRLLDVGTLGVKVGLLSGKAYNGESFTVEARTPRDTFQYTINREPFTAPVVIVSYNDPQGNHRFVTPVRLNTPTENLIAYSGQMLQDPGVEIVTTAPFTVGVNTTNLVVNNPTDRTLTNAHLFLEFVDITGTVVAEIPVTVTLPAGPTVQPVTFNVSTFNPPYDPDQDYIVMAFWTDYQGNILDTAARPISSFQADPRPAFAMSETDEVWDFGTAAQGTLLRRTIAVGSVGFMDLLTYVGSVPGLSISGTGSRRLSPGDVALYKLTLNTADLPEGPFERTLTLRTSDPEHPTRTITIRGNVTPMLPDSPSSITPRTPEQSSSSEAFSMGVTIGNSPESSLTAIVDSFRLPSEKGPFGVWNPSSLSPIRVVYSYVNVRVEPGISSSRIGQVYSGQIFVPVEKRQDSTYGAWYRIPLPHTYSSTQWGWVAQRDNDGTTLVVEDSSYAGYVHTIINDGGVGWRWETSPSYSSVWLQDGNGNSLKAWNGQQWIKTNFTTAQDTCSWYSFYVPYLFNSVNWRPTMWVRGDAILALATIEGYVRDPSGQPVSGVEITSSLPDGSPTYSPQVTTSPSGFYRITDVPPCGQVNLHISHPNYQKKTVSVSNLSPGEVRRHDITIYPSCIYSIQPTSQQFQASEGSGSVSVSAPAGCPWSATSNDPWITITSGSSGNGNGTVNYTVALNFSTTSRTGTITIAGQTFTVNQSGCTYSIQPTSQQFQASGGSGSVSVSALTGCLWSATSNDPWITITSGSSGNGNGTVNYTVAPNFSTTSRTGTITIAGQTFTVNQSGTTSTGSKVRYVRLSANAYITVTLDITIGESGSGPLTVDVDVGDNGLIDWTWKDLAFYPMHLTTGNLASAVNAYLSGRSGEVDVPIRFYIAPFLPLDLADFSAIPSAQADATLTAADITFGAASPTEGDTVNVQATLHNTSGYDTGGLTVSFYATAPGWGEWYIGSAFVPSVPAGGTAQASVAWNTLGFTGAVPVRVVIDPYNRVAETNENNNAAVASVTIRTRPDLRISTITLSDDEPVAGQPVTVTVTLRNTGQTAAGASTLALYDGNPENGGTLVGGIPTPVSGGSESTLDFTWTPTAPGPHRLFAVGDRGNTVNESDEGNNQSWRDVYVGFRGPILVDSGSLSADPVYTVTLGYGVVDEGQADVPGNCGSEPFQTFRRDEAGRVVYRFDHLLPGHFYHLDLTLYECGQGAGRQEVVKVDGIPFVGPEDLGDGEVHRLSILIDPAVYADRTISATVESYEGLGAVVNEIALHDVDYRYADSGGSNDPQYPTASGLGITATGGQTYGWLDGSPTNVWGNLPYQTARVDQADNEVRYRFDGLDALKRYRIHLSFYQGSGANRTQKVQIDGVDTGSSLTIVSGGHYSTTLSVPLSHYAGDGSIVVGVVRTDASVGPIVNEIALEEETQVSQVGCTVTPTPSFAQVYGSVTINGQPAPAGSVVTAENPRGDVVGCVVLTTPGQYPFTPIYGEDATANPPIPGMRAGEPVTFRVNGALAVATPVLYWEDNPIPQRVDLEAGTTQAQSILLAPLWNLVSFNVEPPVPLVDLVLHSIAGKFCRVLGETAIYDCSIPERFRTLKELHGSRGYYLRVEGGASANLLVEGVPIAPTTPISLHQGWNWAGYLPSRPLPVAEALRSIEGKYRWVHNGRGQTYDPILPEFSTLTQMQPGDGYWIYATQPVSLTYPAATAAAAVQAEGSMRSSICGGVTPTPDLMVVYGDVAVNGAPAPVGTRVEVVTPRSDVAGCFIIERAGQYGFMHVYGEDNGAPPLPGFRAGESLHFRVNGVDATVSPAITWQDDPTPRRVDLKVALTWQLYLPFVLKLGPIEP